jgi:hypothetical protein
MFNKNIMDSYLLVGGGKSNSLSIKVKDGVVGADENISQNPTRTNWRIKIKCHESRNASRPRNQDVIFPSQIELTARNHEGNNRESVQVGASAPDAFTYEVGLASKLTVDDSDVLGRPSQKARTRITNGAASRGTTDEGRR